MKSDIIKANITVSKRVWKESRAILKDIGLSRSTFINVTLTQLVKEHEGLATPDDRMTNVVGSLFQLSKLGRRKK